MRSNTHRGVGKIEIPFQQKTKLSSGVSVAEQIDYRGSSITVYQRNIGIAGQRVAFTARVDNPEAAESRYLGYHSKKEALVSKAKDWIDTTVKPEKPKFLKMVSRQRAWELWFEDDAQ